MNNFKRVLVTGGAGFIGSAFIRLGLEMFPSLEKIVNLDLLTYAGNEKNLTPFSHDSRHIFVKGDICNSLLVEELCVRHRIEAIVHFAAETHVDRSIEDPTPFVETNVKGTFCLLEVVRKMPRLRFHHVSTDEVYGSLEKGCFDESSPYQPNSPYAASKAASDHLVRAWGNTYNLAVTISHSSNNYGPYQHEEKFVPKMIAALLDHQPLPIYGTGRNVRDWLFVGDHAEAVWRILHQGRLKEVYDIGSGITLSNLDLLDQLIDCMAMKTSQKKEVLRKLITFVPDRKGHDFRYAISPKKIERELGWQPRHSFQQGLEKTVDWFMEARGLLCKK